MVRGKKSEVSCCHRQSRRRLDEPDGPVQADTRLPYVDTNRRPALRPAVPGKASTSTVDREQAVLLSVACTPTPRPLLRKIGGPPVGKCRLWRSCRRRALWPRATAIEGTEPLPRPLDRPSRCHRQQTLRPCRAQKTVPRGVVCHPPPHRPNLATHDDRRHACMARRRRSVTLRQQPPTMDGASQGRPAVIFGEVRHRSRLVLARADKGIVSADHMRARSEPVKRTPWAARPIYWHFGCRDAPCPIKYTTP